MTDTNTPEPNTADKSTATTSMREIVEPNTDSAATKDTKSKDSEPKEEGNFGWFLVKLVIIVLIFRSFVFTSFNIPSESMMPRLLVGDYLFAAKWPYGYSNRSLPLNAPLIPGRIFADQPEAGDVVIFEHPVDGSDYIKRVIGLPGDEVQLIEGLVHLNGEPVGREQIENYILPIRPNDGCARARFSERLDDGTFVCSYPQFRETLPNGVSFNTLDFGIERQDTFGPVIVPEGRLFLMGDNRDNSLDSRFPAEAGRGIGLVPQDNLVAEASFMYWSTDGNAEWIKPWTWFTATRGSRIGSGI